MKKAQAALPAVNKDLERISVLLSEAVRIVVYGDFRLGDLDDWHG